MENSCCSFGEHLQKCHSSLKASKALTLRAELNYYGCRHFLSLARVIPLALTPLSRGLHKREQELPTLSTSLSAFHRPINVINNLGNGTNKLTKVSH